MKRMLFLITMISLIGTFALATPANAGTQLGHFCWNMAPFSDNIEVAVTAKGGGIFSVHGVWRAPGSYSIPCHGTVVDDPVDGDMDFGMTCEDKIDNLAWIAWHWSAKVQPDLLVGPWDFHRVSDGFQNQGNLVPIPCPIPDPATDISGPNANNK